MGTRRGHAVASIPRPGRKGKAWDAGFCGCVDCGCGRALRTRPV